jgi:hypothetical protein
MRVNHRLEEAIKAGIKIPKDGYWGNTPSRICGAYGGKVDGTMIKEAVNNLKDKIVNNEE